MCNAAVYQKSEMAGRIGNLEMKFAFFESFSNKPVTIQPRSQGSREDEVYHGHEHWLEIDWSGWLAK